MPKIHDNSDKARLERALVIIDEKNKEIGKLENERKEIRELYQFQYRMWYHGSLLTAITELFSLRIKQWYHRRFKKPEQDMMPTTRG